MFKVLIIDDDEAICRMLVYGLSRRGIESDIATNGTDGLYLFKNEHFDVVVTDMLMPGIQGNQVAREIRSSNSPNTPIIGISGTPWKFNESEFDVIIEKPFSIHLLVDTIEDLMTSPKHATA